MGNTHTQTLLILCLQSLALVLNDTLSRTLRRQQEPEHHEEHHGGGHHGGHGQPSALPPVPRKYVVPDYLKVYGEALAAAYGELATAAPHVVRQLPEELAALAADGDDDSEYDSRDDDDDGDMDVDDDAVGGEDYDDAVTVGTDSSVGVVRLDVHSMADELAALRARVQELETNAPRGYLAALERARGDEEEEGTEEGVDGATNPMAARSAGTAVAAPAMGAGGGAGASPV